MLDRRRFRGCLLGLAIGDAVGSAVEFSPRGSFAPVTDLTGGGPFGLPPGYWTDDTSMALCLAESLIACRGMDLEDQCRRYLRWYRQGHYSSKGYCFDIGSATRAALERFELTGNPLAGSKDPDSAGNGSIMRLAPVVLFFARDRNLAVAAAEDSSRTTHQALACLTACRRLAGHLLELLHGRLPALPHKEREEVRGSGYVVESLEAAEWAMAGADSFADVVLRATNLGEDADTTAAVAGQMAGAWFGEDGIPAHWVDLCHRADEIRLLADQLYEFATNP